MTGHLNRRALGTVVLLLGFYVVAGAALGGLVLANVALAGAPGPLRAAAALVSLLAAAAVVRCVVSVDRRPTEPPAGVAVTPDEQPRLWELVNDVADAMGDRRPQQLRIGGDADADVSEAGGLLGLRRGRRRMTVGLGLLEVLDVDGLRAVLAHELGHHTAGAVWLGPLSHRAGVSLAATIKQLPATTLLGRAFLAYAQRCWRMTFPVRRGQELVADAAAVRVGGRSAHVDALEARIAADHTFAVLVAEYATPLWEHGQEPANLFDGFRQLWADPSRQGERASLVEAARIAAPQPTDLHPSLARRIANATSLLDARRPRDRTPARSLLCDPLALERRVSRERSERALAHSTAQRESAPDPAQGTGVAWEDVGQAVYRPALLRAARAFLDEVAVVDGGPGPASIGRLFALLQTDAVLTLAVRLTGELAAMSVTERAEHQVSVVRAGVFASLASALVAGTGARFRLSWSGGPLAIATVDGRVLDVDAWVDSALDDPDGIPLLREQLFEEGVAPGWAPVLVAGTQRPTASSQLIGVVPDVRHRGKPADALVLRDSMALMHVESSAWQRITRSLTASPGLVRDPVTEARLARLVAQPLADSGAGHPRSRRLQWDDVAAARLHNRLRGWRVRLELTDGEIVELVGTTRSPRRKDVAALLTDVLAERLRA